MPGLPSETVTFLFTDIEGSTRLLQELGDRYAPMLADHHRLLRAAFQEQGGVEVESHGDGLYYTFQSAKAALVAAIAAQRAVLRSFLARGRIAASPDGPAQLYGESVR